MIVQGSLFIPCFTFAEGTCCNHQYFITGLIIPGFTDTVLVQCSFPLLLFLDFRECMYYSTHTSTHAKKCMCIIVVLKSLIKDLQDRQLTKNIFFLAKKSQQESSLQSRRTYSCRQLSSVGSSESSVTSLTDDERSSHGRN